MSVSGKRSHDIVSRYISDEIKRLVRQKSFFGCVICGVPVYHYDHIHDYAETGDNQAENLTLLCPTHHQDKTSGRLTRDAVLKFVENPHNGSKKFTASHFMPIVGDTALFEAGTNRFEFSFRSQPGRFSAIEIFRQSILGLHNEEGHLLLDVLLTAQNGDPLVVIEKGELRVSTGVWDYRLEGRDLVISSPNQKPTLQCQFLRNGFSVRRGFVSLRQPGFAVLRKPELSQMRAIAIEPERCLLLPQQSTFTNCTMVDCRVGLSVN